MRITYSQTAQTLTGQWAAPEGVRRARAGCGAVSNGALVPADGQSRLLAVQEDRRGSPFLLQFLQIALCSIIAGIRRSTLPPEPRAPPRSTPCSSKALLPRR